MTKAIDHTGKTYGKLTAICRAKNSKYGKARWLFMCDCIEHDFMRDELGYDVLPVPVEQLAELDGFTIAVPGDVISGKQKGCGCQNRNTPPNYIDRIGKKYGRLTIVGRAPNRPQKGRTHSASYSLCLCDCGNELEIRTVDVTSGKTTSCGCFHKEQAKISKTTHGKSNSTEYKAYHHMIDRCYNPKNTVFDYYGGRGIQVCKRWNDKFESFYEDMGPKPDKAYSIERIDVNKGYQPDNCQWASKTTQANNTTRNRKLEAFGEINTAAQWAKISGVDSRVILRRIDDLGWDVEAAITRTVQQRNRQNSAYNVWAGMKQRCDNPNHIHYSCYGGRGIAYDPKWANYRCFINDVGDRPSPQHSLDRKDTNGNYVKENVRWILSSEQQANTSKTVWLEIDGVCNSIQFFIDKYHIDHNAALVRSRLGRGWSHRDALFTLKGKKMGQFSNL